MSATVRWVLLAVAALAATVALADRLGLLRLEPAPIVVTPELVAAGRKVYRDRCHGCHGEIPLAKRVRDWPARKAYEVIGRLPEVTRSMPPFPGTDEERRALAAWIAELGAGRISQR
jgi:mono/diheme cytochrome c family protein